MEDFPDDTDDGHTGPSSTPVRRLPAAGSRDGAMDRPRANNRPAFVPYAGIATAALAWAAIRWPPGRSLIGFESMYWDLGLLPTLAALTVVAYRLKSATGRQKRFLLGFLSCGLFAAVAYTASCSRTAHWSLASVLQPFQTGFMLAPGMKSSWRDLRPWGIFVDSVILVLIPLLPALLGGLVVSVRIPLRRMMVTVAVIAILFGGVTATIRRGRQQDRMGHYHRDQIVGVLHGHAGPDGRIIFEPRSVDRSGKAVPPHQQRLDRWHEALVQRYWRSSYYPWSAAFIESPPPDGVSKSSTGVSGGMRGPATEGRNSRARNVTRELDEKPVGFQEE